MAAKVSSSLSTHRLLLVTLCCACYLFLLVNAQSGGQATVRYPKNAQQKRYLPDSDVKWRFQSPPGTCNQLKFRWMEIEDTNGCVNDYLNIHDGYSADAPILHHLCGRVAPSSPIVTTKNNTFVRFVSNSNPITGKGFKFDVSRVPCRSSGQSRPIPPVVSQSMPVCGNPSVAPVETGLYNGSQRLHRRYLDYGADGTEATADDEEEEDFTDQARIVGGQVARGNSWPWQISIRYQGSHICGGTLISRRYIISAAHCFKTISTNPMDFEFWAGKQLKEEREPGKEQQLVAEEITLHENYERGGKKHDNDMALIRLQEPGATFNQYVKPACLPATPTQQPADGSPCYVTGFGTTKGTGGDEELKQAAVPVVSNQQCSQMDKRIEKLITNNMLCAGYATGGHDSCQGDSGGPLVCKIGAQNTWVLSGVVSFGFGCAGKSSPGVYARVTQYLPWLQARIGDLPTKRLY